MSRNQADLPFVEAKLNYLAPMPEKPFNYTYDPPPGVPRTNAVYDERVIAIHNARPIAARLTLDGEGIALAERRTSQRDFDDEDELRRIYYPESAAMVAAASGAARVVVFDHTIRRRNPNEADLTKGTPRQPMTRVHADFTVTSGPQRVRDVMGEEAGEFLRRRFAFINLWRPIKGPLVDAPLALCDARSTVQSDFIGVEQRYRDRKGEIYFVTHNPAHRWLYVPQMRADEALLIKCYDSVAAGVARFVPHSAFEDPTMPANPLPRESIEIRTIAFFA
jgi:hypothetical protein